MTIDEAIEKAIEHLQANRTVGRNVQALHHLQRIPRAMQDAGPAYAEAAKRAQILYALSNMASWVGAEAREVKRTLKTFAAPGTGGME